MKRTLQLLSVLLLAGGWHLAVAAVREEAIELGENRKVSIEVPTGFRYSTGTGSTSPIAFKLAGPNDGVTLDVEFLPDPEGRFANARARRELLHELFSEYVKSSSEQAMQFEELEPRIGAGSYCVFTDAALVGKTELPAGEYLHLTAGVKAWPGVVAIFRCFSNDTKSPPYQAVLRVLRASVHEKLAPMK